MPIPLYDILSLDEQNMTVRVEPMVSVGDITRFLVPRGYTLAVTLEIADATLGGLGKSYWHISIKTIISITIKIICLLFSKLVAWE